MFTDQEHFCSSFELLEGTIKSLAKKQGRFIIYPSHSESWDYIGQYLIKCVIIPMLRGDLEYSRFICLISILQ